MQKKPPKKSAEKTAEKSGTRSSSALRIVPLTPERWDDFARLFGERGACEGCWCMTPRLTRSAYLPNRGEKNKRAMHRLVESGAEPGLLAYRGGEAIGWIALGPRSEYVRLASSRVAKPVDDRPAWSIVCFFIRADHRRTGLSARLIEAAAKHARSRGAELLEAFPIDAKTKQIPPVFSWTGIASAFEGAGFEEVARRTPTRPFLRKRLTEPGPRTRRTKARRT